MARKYSSFSWIVKARTRTPGARLPISLVASRPLIPGIPMSIRTTSGISEQAASTASRPVLASPTTSMSGCASKSESSPARTIPWSSASNTRILLVFLHSFLNPFQRYPETDPGALSRLGPDRKGSAQEVNPLLHAPQSPALLWGLRHQDLLQLQSPAVVLDDARQDRTPQAQTHRSFGRPTMTNDIGQGLL